MATNTLGSLIINVESNTNKLVEGFNRAEQTVNKSVSAMKTSIGTLASAYVSLSSATNLLQTAGQFEQYATSLKVLSGSASQAEKAFAWVKDFTAKTPYTLNETMEAFIRLKAYGIDATSGSLKTLGDTASAMGKPLMAAVEAMADAMVGENERLKEFGIRASKQGETIAYKWMDASGQAKTKIIQNNSEIIQSTLEAIFNEKYAGMMDEQSKTWVGAVSNLEDTWTSLKDTIARDSGIFDVAKDSVKGLNDILSGQNQTVKEYAEQLDSIALAAGSFYGTTLGVTAVKALIATEFWTKRVTVAQIAMNVTAWANPWVILAAAIGGATFALSEYKDLQNEINANNAKIAASTAFLNDLRAVQGKSHKEQLSGIVERSKALQTEQRALIATYNERKKYAYQSSKNDKEQSDREERIRAISAEQAELVKYSNTLKNLMKVKQENTKTPNSTITPPSTTKTPKVKGGKTESEKEFYQDVPEMTKAFDVYDAMNTARNEKELKFIQDEKQAQIDKWDTLFQKVENFDDFYASIADLQGSLDLDKDILSGWNDFGANLDGIAGKIGNFAKTFSDMSKNNQKFITKDIELQNKYAKAFIDAKDDEEKQKFAMAEFDNAQAKNKQDQLQSELAGYASIAGSLGTLFEQGSAGAKAMAILQGGLAIVSAGAGGDPYTVIPRMIAAAAVVHQALSASGISGNGTSAAAPDANFDLQRDLIEADYTPITDILNRHTDLLESIERNGSASQLGVELAGSEFTRDYRTWVEDTLEKARTGSVNGKASTAELERLASIVENAAGFDFYDISGRKVKINLSALREGFNLIDALVATLATGGWGTLGQADIKDFNSPTAWAEQMGSIRGSLNEVQNLISDWAMSVVESMHDLTDAADDFRGYFDDITGSMFYETKRLKQAFDDVDRLRGDRSFSSYLQDTITNIDNLEKFFTDETFALLMSDSLEDIQGQIQAINELSAVTGETFEGGAREALDYLESIQLVAEAMATSRENIKTFTESLFGDRLSALNMASSLGVASLATDTEQLADMFYRLSGDMDGLTDSDMELLNANLELLKSTDTLNDEQNKYNDTLNEVTGNISTLNGVLGNIQKTIDNLRGAAGGAEYTMEMFRQSMSKALSLKGSRNYEDFAKAVQEATGYSSVLMDSANFEFSRDQRFAQAVAANQFATLEDATLDQIDYLKMIEENTRAQVEILSASINNLADTIDSELLKSIQARDPNTGYIASKYQEVLGRAGDEAGLNYWANQIASGAVSQSGLGIAIGAAGVANGELSRAKYVEMLYEKGLGRTGTSEEIDYWANNSSTPTTALASMFAQLEPSFHSFDVGTARVTQDMLAKIHKDEIITPAPMSEGLRNGTLMMGDQSGIIMAINNLGNRMASVEKVLSDSRDIQSGCLSSLQYIEEVS